MDTSGETKRVRPWHGLVLYLAVGACWVLAGDLLLAAMALDVAAVQRYQLWKGWVFVLATGALAWWLLRHMQAADSAQALAAQHTAHVLRHAPAGIARVGMDGRIVWANERLSELTGVAVPALQGQDFRDLVQATDRGWAQRQRERLLAGEIDHYQGERQCRQPGTGALVPVVCTVTLVPAAGAEAAHLVCALQDIREIHAAREALERSEAGLRLALEGSGSGMWDWDLQARSGIACAGLQRLLRYRGADFAQAFALGERLHPAERWRVLRAARRAVATGARFSEAVRILCFDGQYRWFTASGQRHLDAQGRPARFSGILTDLTDQRRADARRRLAATVVDNTMEGVVVTDAQSRILSVNAAFTRLMGYTEDELLGQTPRIFKSGRHDRAFYEGMWEHVQRTGHWQGEIWNRRKSGEVFPEHMSLSAVRDAAGAVTHYVCMFIDISEQKAQRQRLEFLAHKDPLTGLGNRAWFSAQLDSAVAQARGSGEHLAVLQLNLDRFKDVNDSYGYAVGDQVLAHIARQVQAVLRPGDLLGRMAGDEMAVVVRHLRHADGAAAVARQLIAAVGEPWRSPEGFEVVAGASVGICLFPEHADTGQALVQGAHAAVYGAKARGRGAWCFFHEDMTQAARERLALEARLRLAMAQGQLHMHYQPQVDIATGRIAGAEALLRWHDPAEGMVSPARFIPVAESSGLIGPLGEWVLGEVCRQGRRWLDDGLPPLTLAVNVSPRQFHLSDLVACTEAVLSETGFPATHLELEITESVLADRPEEALQVLTRLGDLGMRLAVDDFGTGYSSLALIKRFPIDVLKIDQGFIREIPHSAGDMAISAAIIAMGHSMGLQVVAEGVETAAQLQFLRERHCDTYQGYLRSRPLPAAEFAALLRAQADGGAPA
ncbi:GGDEF domain-containing protein [Rhodococcus sp. SRB_17]|nr:GGDEF domain-containing protein [Rhodococcus sp. SRB_17]